MTGTGRRTALRRAMLTLMFGVLAATLAAVMWLAPGVAPGAPDAQAQTDPDDPQSRIVGGTAVPDGKYPFVTALLDKRASGSAYERQFCGGTLIDRDSVMTAAHCIEGSGASASDLQITAGRTVLDSSQGQVRGVSGVDVHPKYSYFSRSQAYDVAVLTLKRPVSGIQTIKPATANQDGLESPGRNLTVAGWGNTEQQPASGGGGGQNYPNRMREAQVPVVSDEQARQAYPSYASALSVAAGREGKDSCQGDSGGPMFASTSNGPVQVGITSYGAGCAAEGYPGVYTEVNAPAISNFVTNRAAN